MTNVVTSVRTEIRHEVLIPLLDGKATRRDVADLLTFADIKYRDLHPDDPHIANSDLYDDAYYVEVRDHELVAVIKVDAD
jgi:hypothetical protein